MKKDIMYFDNERYNLTISLFQSFVNNANEALSKYSDLEVGLLQDSYEAQQFRLDPISFAKQKIESKSTFKDASFDFKLEASGLTLNWSIFVEYVENKREVLKQDLFDFDGHFKLKQSAIDKINEECTVYVTDEVKPGWEYYNKLAADLNKGIKAGYLNSNYRTQIVRAIPAFLIDVDEKTGDYIISVNHNFINYNNGIY
jgi:hypothetical protein